MDVDPHNAKLSDSARGEREDEIMGKCDPSKEADPTSDSDADLPLSMWNRGKPVIASNETTTCKRKRMTPVNDTDDDAPLFPMKARVGDYVEVYWASYRRWFKGTVTEVSDGTAIHPLRDGTVNAGHSIVDYGEGKDGGKSVHLLDDSMHFTDQKRHAKKRDFMWRMVSGLTGSGPSVKAAKRSEVKSSVFGGSHSKRCALDGASLSLTRAIYCDPCGLDGNEYILACCSECNKSHRCAGCLRLEDISHAGNGWKCDTCRWKCPDRRPTCDPAKPPEKCLQCQTKISSVAEPPDHFDCNVCGSSLCHDCGCTLETDVKTAVECWVCAGAKFKDQRKARIEQWAKLSNPSVRLTTPANRKSADDFALMVYRLRMQNCFDLVQLAIPSLVKVLNKDASSKMPCMTPSQLVHFIGMDNGFNFQMFKLISTAYSVSASKEATSLLAMCAGRRLHVKPLARIPNDKVKMRLALALGDFGMHPLMDMYVGPIHEFLDNEEVELVLLLFGSVDRTYAPLAQLLEKAVSKGRVVELGKVTASNQADVFKRARDEELHACVDCIGSASGSERVRAIITAKIAPMQAHHLNSPFLQYPVQGTGNGFMVADPVMFPPQGVQTRLGGSESILKVSCWMNPLRPDRFDMTATRERFGLDPDKLYLVFPALNSKLDPAALNLWASVLASTTEDVLLWFISYPKLGAINIVDCLKKSQYWDEKVHAKRVVIGQHLPQDLHLARLAAFATGGRGAIFLNVALTYPAHTTGQEGVCVGMLIICMIRSMAGSTQRAAATFMHQLGLDDCVANDEDGVLALVQYWSHKDQDARRKKLRDDLRHEFLTQTGPFFDQRRIPSEIVRGFRTIAKNSLDESPDGLRVSNKPVDARLDEFSPSASRVTCNTGCKPLIPCEPSSQLALIMRQILNLQAFVEEQIPMVQSILFLALENGIYPDEVIGKGSFTVAIRCLNRNLEEGVLSLEFHRVFLKVGDINLHNCEIARGAYAEHALNMRKTRSKIVKAVENPVRNGDFSCAFGHTKPAGDKGEVVVFRYRALLRNRLQEFLKEEFDDWFRQTGELRDKVRIVQQAVHAALGQLNDQMRISHLDVSPANLYIEGRLEESLEEDQIGVVLPDLGNAAVHALPDQISSHPVPLLRKHSTSVDPEKHKRDRKKKVKKTGSAGSSNSKEKPFRFLGWTQNDSFFKRHAQKGGTLKSFRGGTAPFRNSEVKGEMLTPALGQHIDLFAVVRILLWKLAPISRGETIEEWDRRARAAAVSTDAMGAFIASRMPANLQEGHPRQPLMWQRLLDYLVKGLQPWSPPEHGQEAKVTLSKMTTCLFLAMPFLAAADDRLLANGGHIDAPGGDVYGTGIHRSLQDKSIKKVRIQVIPGKGLGAVAAERMLFGELVGLYLAGSKPKLENGSESRFAVSILGADYTYVARFTPKRHVRWYIDEKKSTGPIFNAPGPGEKGNCILERSKAWDDDQDKDFGRFLKIIPITVSSETVEEGQELMFEYDHNASRNRNFPVT